MKKITSKLVAVLMIVVMAFGISGTATVKTEAKESKGYVIKVNLGTNCTTVYQKWKSNKGYDLFTKQRNTYRNILYTC